MEYDNEMRAAQKKAIMFDRLQRDISAKPWVNRSFGSACLQLILIPVPLSRDTVDGICTETSITVETFQWIPLATRGEGGAQL